MTSQLSTPAIAFAETAFVACNIYISSASSPHYILQNLLRSVQDRCRSIRHHETESTALKGISSSTGLKKTLVAVVHAFADVPYNRSSFHLAGRSDCVADVAVHLILDSFDKIDFDSSTSSDSAHPFVGLIDHVSVMPLVSFPMVVPSLSTKSAASGETGLHISQVAAVDAARATGGAISNTQQLANVFYYGLACPNHTPLAKVRKEKTRFFNSGGSRLNGHGKSTISEDVQTTKLKGDCTIGVPFHFVENFNIRLSPNVEFAQAKTLTQHLRGRNNGVEGVEALTLPYRTVDSAGKETIVYEVACNLTNPEKGSADMIKEAVGEWIQKQTSPSELEKSSDAGTYFIDKMYRVGTTEEQCIDTLLKGYTEDDAPDLNYWEAHDRDVFDKFQNYLMQKDG